MAGKRKVKNAETWFALFWATGRIDDHLHVRFKTLQELLSRDENEDEGFVQAVDRWLSTAQPGDTLDLGACYTEESPFYVCLGNTPTVQTLERITPPAQYKLGKAGPGGANTTYVEKDLYAESDEDDDPSDESADEEDEEEELPYIIVRRSKVVGGEHYYYHKCDDREGYHTWTPYLERATRFQSQNSAKKALRSTEPIPNKRKYKPTMNAEVWYISNWQAHLEEEMFKLNDD